MQPEISVIVPAYNEEKHLQTSLNSLLTQTFQNWEAWVVDDGSSDGTPEICDTYEKKDARIHVIHQKNQGISKTRNHGVAHARGEYLAFLDSDDFYEPQMLETMVKALDETKADFAFCGHLVDQDGKTIRRVSDAPRMMNRWELCQFLSQGTGNDFLWNKVFRRSFWGNQQFPAGKCYEDAFAITELLPRCRKVCYVGTPLYHYVQNNAGITRSKPTLRILDGIEAKQLRLQQIQALHPDLAYLANRQLVLFLLWTEYLICGQGCDPKLKQRESEVIAQLRHPMENLGFVLGAARMLNLYARPLFILASKVLIKLQKR